MSKLNADATVEDVIHTVPKPEEYVRQVLSRLHECRRIHANAHVRIGVMGEGKEPSFKILYYDKDQKENLYRAYSSYGNESAYDGYKIHEDTWSLKSMDIEGIKQLIAKVRGWDGKR